MKNLSKKALASWDKVCLPQAAGGLNVLNLCRWNKAAIIKQLWSIAQKKDCLWIKWVHSYYIKKQTFDSCPIPKTTAWVIRKILETRDTIMQQVMVQGDLLAKLGKMQNKDDSFSIKKMMATADRLQMIGIQAPMACVFCHGGIETHEYLFFECPVTGALWLRLLTWLGYIRNRGDAKHELQWVCSMAKRKSGLGAITRCAYAMAVYVIWRERNLLRFQKSTYDEDRDSREIAVHIHIRGQNLRKWRKPLSLLSSYPY
nr:uncharacterized protein LOC108946707 [Nicotiana tomentosiformis]